MNRNYFTMAIAVVLVVVARGIVCNADDPTSRPSANAEPTSRPVANAENTFTFTPSSKWTRTDKNRGGNGRVMVLRLYGEDEVSLAIIYIDRYPAPQLHTLDDWAKLRVDEEKSYSPDLNKDCAVETIKLEGVDARVIKYRSRRRALHPVFRPSWRSPLRNYLHGEGYSARRRCKMR